MPLDPLTKPGHCIITSIIFYISARQAGADQNHTLPCFLPSTFHVNTLPLLSILPQIGNSNIFPKLNVAKKKHTNVLLLTQTHVTF